jgi:hypothetical protein
MRDLLATLVIILAAALFIAATAGIAKWERGAPGHDTLSHSTKGG